MWFGWLVTVVKDYDGRSAIEATVEPSATKAEQWKDVIKIGRTHLQDATPLTLGQEWSVYKPLLIHNLMQSVRPLTDGCVNFRRFLVEGTQPNLKRIGEFVERSLMLVTALSPVIGYDKASKIAHFALDHDLTLKEAALQLGFVDAAEFDRIVDPRTMVVPHVATA